jgi:CheY-like chemotaxis protein
MFVDAMERALHRSSVPAPSIAGKPLHAAAPAPQILSGMRLLVVEDNVINQQVAQELLTSQGAMVTIAPDGRAGVDAVLTVTPPFDAVLMDLQMPVMDGLTATRAIRAHSQFAQLPIIAMTANAMQSDRDDCLAAGMTDHVGKPFDLKDLVNTLVRLTLWTSESASSDTVPTLEAVSWPPEIAVDSALRRLGGNVGLMQRTLQSFVNDAEDMPQRMKVWLAGTDLETMQRELHAFKGLAGTLGIASLSRLAADVEQLARLWETDVLQASVQALTAEVHHLLPLLKDVAQRLLPPKELSAAGLTSPQTEVPGAWMAQLEALHVALLASDMGAMELHAQLRFVPIAALESALTALDDAMAELDFEQAAVECEKIIQHYAPHTRQ